MPNSPDSEPIDTAKPCPPPSPPDSPLSSIATPSPIPTPLVADHKKERAAHLPSPRSSSPDLSSVPSWSSNPEQASASISTLPPSIASSASRAGCIANPDREVDVTHGPSLSDSPSSPLRHPQRHDAGQHAAHTLPIHLRGRTWPGYAKVHSVRGSGNHKEVLVSFRDLGNDSWWVRLTAVPPAYRRIAMATAKRIARITTGIVDLSQHQAKAAGHRKSSDADASTVKVDKIQLDWKRRVRARMQQRERVRQSTPQNGQGCVEVLRRCASHGGAVRPCSIASAHKDDSRAAIDDTPDQGHLVCTSCHDGHYEAMWTVQEKKELIRTGMLDVSVGCRALCQGCGWMTLQWKGMVMPAVGQRWGTCDCVTYTGAWACGNCRIEELEGSLRWKGVDQGMARLAGAEAGCKCGQPLTGKERVWECSWCGGLVVTTGTMRMCDPALRTDATALLMLGWHKYLQGGEVRV